MATNASTTTPLATAPPSVTPTEQTPLNTEKGAVSVELGSPQKEGSVKVAEKNSVEEIKEKIKKPTIGITLVLFLILNIVMFFVGITTTSDCPKRPVIPIYLAVAGALGVLTKVIPIANRNRRLVIVDRILMGLVLVEFIWMILGSVWIYGIYQPNFNPALTPNYCNKTAYLLAFWLLTIHYITLALSILVPCCIICGCFCCTAIVASKLASADDDQ